MSFPVLNRYDTPNGQGARFELSNGVIARLEPREEAVALGWSLSEDFGDTAGHLGEFAQSALKVALIRNGELKETRKRGLRLARYLNRLQPLDLVRVDSESASVVYERNPEPELTVIASTWAEADILAYKLGAQNVSSVIHSLVAQLGREDQ